jgi:tRNA (cytidine/uridine-2'-O-)-methyltransferase
MERSGVIDVVLVAPEIPGNTGNIIRLCANTGARLHLVEPLGFNFDNKHLERAGLDYRDLAEVTIHTDWATCRARLGNAERWFAFSSYARQHFGGASFRAGDVFVFGSESRGLSDELLAEFPDTQRLRLPMRPAVRSLNVSNAVAVAVYEAWRQQGFAGGT